MAQTNQPLHFTLPSGRRIMLTRISMSLTYDGHLEGSRETISESILKEPDTYYNRNGHRGFQLIPPSVFPLPDCTWRAIFESAALERTDDFACSLLNVCWFTEPGVAVAPIPKIIEAILPELIWEDKAEDHGSWFD